ncbi:MAG: exonuclease [Bacteroidota bacterium]
MSWIMVDVEADGPIPGDYSMVSLGAVLVDDKLDRTFFGELKPISDNYVEEALQIANYTRSETLNFSEPKRVLLDFEDWLQQNTKGRPQFISDNNGFDWMFVCWYFHHFLGRNPFGHSSQNLGSLYKGLVADTSQNFKHLRKTAHTHHPVDDAIGNAEALVRMKKDMDLKVTLQ